MLTGLTRATAGECVIWGHRLSSDLQSIREITGICPQQNILFPFLTVEEHLYFFCRIKGVAEKEIHGMVLSSLTDVGLLEKRYVPVHALSGGMKRKTCLAIALAGDPLCVFLDEPTSGMDPYSRRSTWELLQKKKKGRVIILTTHFLEEAEILGDRIVIMSDGKLRCSGSTLYLKSKFGAGYMLTITWNPHTNAEEGVVRIGDDENKVVNLVQSHIPDAKKYSSIGAELVMELPMNASPLFPSLFASLKRNTVTTNSKCEDIASNTPELSASSCPIIASYGIQYVTLEQVFIRLADAEKKFILESNDDDASYRQPDSQKFTSTVSAPESLKVRNDETSVAKYGSLQNVDKEEGSVHEKPGYLVVNQRDKDCGDLEMTILGFNEEDGIDDKPRKVSQIVPVDDECELPFDDDDRPSNLMWIQLFELFRKRCIIASRDKKGLFFQILIPAIQIALVLAVLAIDVNPAGRSLPMRADIYEETVTAVLSDNSTMINPEDYRENLKRMYFSNTNTTSSDEISDFMLSTYSAPEGDRFGGYVYNDTITLNVTVDWIWVQDNIDLLLNNSASILPLLDDVLDISIGNNSASFDFNISSSSPFVVNALDAIFGNESYVVVNNVTLYRTNVTDFIDENEDILVGEGGELSFDSIEVGDGEIVVVGVEIVINNNTINLGNFSLTAGDLVVLLPNQTISYSSTIASNYSVLQNSTSPHAVGVFISELVTAAFVGCREDSSAVYSLRNHPLPLTIEQAIEIQVILSVLASLFILIPLCYIPATFVIFIVKERTSKSKHLQLVSGVSPYLYWAASYMWDTAMYFLLAGFIMLTFVLYGEENAKIFIGDTEAGWAVYVLLLCYGLSSIPLSYVYSLAFDNHSTAQISIMTWNFFTGFVFVMAFYIMISIPSTRETAESLVHFFRIFPPYNIGEGLINISVNYFDIYVLEGNTSYFAWEVTGRNLAFMIAEMLTYFLIILMTEWTFFRKVYGEIVKKYVQYTTEGNNGSFELGQDEEDDDVAAEREMIKTANPNDYILYINDIKKTYSPPVLLGGSCKYAVRGIHLACAAGERFGE